MRPENLVDAPHIDSVVPNVIEILNDASIIVGHGLEHDMEVLGLRFPEDQVRDTSLYGPFINRRGRTPGLKSLVKKHLGYDIQVKITCILSHLEALQKRVFLQLGEHDPVEDARAALNLYLKEMKAWEEKVNRRKQVVKMMSQVDQAGDYNGNDINDNVTTSNRYNVLVLESR